MAFIAVCWWDCAIVLLGYEYKGDVIHVGMAVVPYLPPDQYLIGMMLMDKIVMYKFNYLVGTMWLNLFLSGCIGSRRIGGMRLYWDVYYFVIY